ncbi:MAG: hypothetical protein CMB41_04915 [Euryarchaeota archaeon]|nr:hypothetical protein [Euryarchaeota archaeon]
MANLPRPSDCGTFHISSEGEGIYTMRFDWVLPFHEPSLAPVGDDTGAYHIHLDGKPAYEQRFDRTFGFYGGFAAVIFEGTWFHITADGKRAYPKSWNWCGNFQQNRCTVRTADGHYHHIRPDGSMLNGGPHSYAGDFREGSGVVRGMDGMCWHIDKEGAPIHDSKFLDLDVFHKGFARARDRRGWHHIDRAGKDISEGKRYAELEPFYNGQALARSLTGEYVVINEFGEIKNRPLRPDTDIEVEFQRIAVSYWKPIAIRLGILAGLAGGHPELEITSEDKMVLQQAWMELGLLGVQMDLTQSGELLAQDERWRDRFLYWTGPQFKAWVEAENRLMHVEKRSEFFIEQSKDPKMANLIHRVLDSYANDDWRGISSELQLSPSDVVVDIGGGKGALLEEIGDSVSARVLVDLPEVIDLVNFTEIETVSADIFSDEIPTGDVYLMSRILHDWGDSKCIELLYRIPKTARLIIIDRIAEPEKHGLLSLNMLLLTGGRERTHSEWMAIFSEAGWSLTAQSTWASHAIMHLEAC